MTAEDNRYCKGCEYFSSSSRTGEGGQDSCCMYIVHRKRRRPDPGGVGCTLHTKKGRKMAEWNKERAAQLLQAGMMGKDVAAEVGTSPSVISKWRDYLMGMKVPPLEEAAVNCSETPGSTAGEKVEEIQMKHGLFEGDIPKGSIPPSWRELTASAPLVVTAEKKPDIQVTIDIGKGRVHLEAENAKVLETLINMMVAMGGRE